MPHTSSRERLGTLLDLAAQGAAGRAALLDELANLLVDWPADYVQAMRGPFEALFEKTVREAAPEVRAGLAERLADHDELPVALLNELFLDASPAARAHILRRNAALDEPGPVLRADASALVCAARRMMNGAFAGAFAEALELPDATARMILRDAQALAITCKGAGLDRAAGSAITVLAGSAPFAGWDDIPEAGAGRLTAFWRARG